MSKKTMKADLNLLCIEPQTSYKAQQKFSILHLCSLFLEKKKKNISWTNKMTKILKVLFYFDKTKLQSKL